VIIIKTTAVSNVAAATPKIHISTGACNTSACAAQRAAAH
jgi:hypothetical protein